MKKIIFALAIILGTMGNMAMAQAWDIELPTGVYATGEQWHYDGYSIIETNRDYLYVNNGGYHHWVTIPPMEVIGYHLRPTTRIFSTRPYILNGYGYWYVNCSVGEYLVDSRGVWHRQNSYYTYHSNYRYSLRGLRTLSFTKWHLYHNRHHYRGHHHHGHHYAPPRAHNDHDRHSSSSRYQRTAPAQNNTQRVTSSTQRSSSSSNRSSTATRSTTTTRSTTSTTRSSSSASRSTSSRSSSSSSSSYSRGASSSSRR